MLRIVFHQPEIPQNTGSTARLCAGTGAELHLIKPLGFSLEDRYLKRAGLDYWPAAKMIVHESLDAFFEAVGGARIWLVSKSGKIRYDLAKYEADDCFVFGSETRGLPRELLDRFAERTVHIPIRESVRSLNLATSAGIILYEAFRQTGFPPHEHDPSKGA